MQYLDFLQRVHETLRPPTYLEIGIRHGHSLALSSATTVAVDPDYDLKRDPPPDARLFEEESDAFFARPDALDHFGGRATALSFIDGMHLAEFALRDFINVERTCTWSSVVVIDDILPRTVDEAARGRSTRAWTGDVYKLLGIFEERRPDLVTLRVDVAPTGVLLVLALDSGSRVLGDAYDEIEAQIVTPDPQEVPPDILSHEGALDPEKVLTGSFWNVLRDGHDDPEKGRAKLRKAVRKDFFAKGLSRLLR
jgi:hypothetical protein